MRNLGIVAKSYADVIPKYTPNHPAPVETIYAHPNNAENSDLLFSSINKKKDDCDDFVIDYHSKKEIIIK